MGPAVHKVPTYLKIPHVVKDVVLKIPNHTTPSLFHSLKSTRFSCDFFSRYIVNPTKSWPSPILLSIIFNLLC